MLTFNNLEEMKPFYNKETSTYVFRDDITINFHLRTYADIDAWNINAWNISAGDINAWDINAGDINARSINVGSINAGDINARNINANNIDAGDIKYWAVCIARNSFKCKSVKGRRENSIHKCLDQEIEFIKD